MKYDFRLPPPMTAVAPEKLFRLLTRVPRPRLDMAHRMRVAPQIALSAQALSRCEEQEIQDAVDALAEDERANRRFAGYAAACLLADDKLAFGSPGEAQELLVGRLTPEEAEALEGALYEALSIISPHITRSDYEAWEQRLELGAQDTSNLRTAGEMFETCDWIAAAKVVRVPRPERYFGLSPLQLMEGHKLTYAAACRAVEKQGSGRKA